MGSVPKKKKRVIDGANVVWTCPVCQRENRWHWEEWDIPENGGKITMACDYCWVNSLMMKQPTGYKWTGFTENKVEEEVPPGTDNRDALSIQAGGNHYKNFTIQPVEFISKNNLNFLQGCIIKRICRYRVPGGKGLQDLEKIKHEIDLIIQLEGWNSKEAPQV